VVPKLNYALMIILSAGLLAGITVLAVSVSGKTQSRTVTDAELKALLNMLCSDKEETVVQAEKRLAEIGLPAKSKLLELANSENPEYAARAQRVIALIDRAPASRARP